MRILKFFVVNRNNMLWLRQLKFISPLCRIYASVNRVSISSDIACRLFGAKPLSKPMVSYS